MKVFILIIQNEYKLHAPYIYCLWQIAKKYTIDIHVYSNKFYKGDKEKSEKLKKLHFYLSEYNSLESLTGQVQQLAKNNEIIYIEAFQEELVTYTQRLKKTIWLVATDNIEIFTNKRLQRELMSKNKEISVQFFSTTVWELDYKKIKTQLWESFFIKQESWCEWMWAKYIKSTQDIEEYKGNHHQDIPIVVEEYLDGDLYCIDYFVDTEWNISSSPAMYSGQAKDFWVVDNFVYTSTQPFNFQKAHISEDIVRSLLTHTVEACSIRNTFVCQEFKHQKDGSIRSIEINGRIWWRCQKNYLQWYGINIYDYIFQQSLDISTPAKGFVASINIYATKSGYLKSYNYPLLEKIRQLPSCDLIEIFPKRRENRRIGLPKDGFCRVWIIGVTNEDKEQFTKDYNFIKENYPNLLVIE